MGCNGMGKIMLMKFLIGVLFFSGNVKLGNVDVGLMKSYQWVVNGMSFVFQGRMIFFIMIVKENIEIGLIFIK